MYKKYGFVLLVMIFIVLITGACAYQYQRENPFVAQEEVFDDATIAPKTVYFDPLTGISWVSSYVLTEGDRVDVLQPSGNILAFEIISVTENVVNTYYSEWESIDEDTVEENFCRETSIAYGIKIGGIYFTPQEGNSILVWKCAEDLPTRIN